MAMGTVMDTEGTISEVIMVAVANVLATPMVFLAIV